MIARRSRAIRSTAAAFLSQFGSFAIIFGVTVTLARILTPSDFGLYGIALALTGFLDFARQGGLVVPVIQSESLTAAQLNNLVWFNGALGLSLTLLMIAVSPLAGHLYADARLPRVVSALAMGFVVTGLSTQHAAWLRREMRFTALAACEISAVLVAGALAIVVARAGAGYWALVCFQLVREVVLATLVMGVSRLRTSWPRRDTAIGPLLRFGGVMMAFELLGYLNFRADNLIVGWGLGPAALGFYSKAYDFLLLPVNQINTPLSGVAHATLSRLQRDPVAYTLFLRKAVLLSTGLGLPATVFLYWHAAAVVEYVFGPQWRPAIAIARALAPASACLSVTAAAGWIFLSLGRARRQLWWAGGTTLITVAAFWLGLSGGAVGVAYAFSITRVALLVPTLMFTCHGTFVRWTSVLATVVRPAVASAMALLTSVWLDRQYPMSPWTLPRNAALFGAVYAACWCITRSGRRELREYLPVPHQRVPHA